MINVIKFFFFYLHIITKLLKKMKNIINFEILNLLGKIILNFEY